MEEKVYTVHYSNEETRHNRQFNDLDEAMIFAENRWTVGWSYVKVVDYFNNVVVEFEN